MLESIKRKGAKEKRTILLKLFLKITPDEDTVCRIILFSSTLCVRIFIEKVVRKILSKKSFFVMELQFFFFIFLSMLFSILKNYCHALLILSEDTINLFLFCGKKKFFQVSTPPRGLQICLQSSTM